MATASATPAIRRSRAALRSYGLRAVAAGSACWLLVALAVAAAHAPSSPLVPGHDGGDTSWSWLYLAAAACAFAFYLTGLYLLRRPAAARLGAVLSIAAAVQLAPLAGPVLLSTDVYTYWDYGRIAAVHGDNPYETKPSVHADDPAYPRMGARWRETTSVYGPGFTLASEAHALAAGESPTAAAWLYKGLAAAAMLALTVLAAALAANGAFAAAFVGWNPLLALHFAGGGHNDAWMMALVLVAVALAASGRRQLAGAAWALSIAIKWLPLLFLPLRALEARRRGRAVGHLGFAVGAGIIVTIATFRYGGAWAGAFGLLADSLREQARYSIPSRIASLGVPEDLAAGLLLALFALAYAWLLREAWRGKARLGLAAGLLLLATPWLVPWYAVWTVPLAAIEEDGPARWLALGLSAYLLRDAVPL